MSLSPGFIEGLWVRKSFSAAGHTLLVYDYLLTFRDEASFVYIWHAPWTVVKVLFLLHRYGNLIGQTAIRLEEAGLLAHNSQAFCRHFAIFTTCFMFASSELIHSTYIYRQSLHVLRVWGFSVLVLVRAWAIWGARKWVTNILAWSYVCYVVMLLYGSAHSLSTGNSGSFCSDFIFIRNNGSASVVHFLFLDVIQSATSKNMWLVAFKSCSWLVCFGSFTLDTVLFVLTMRSLRRYSMEFQQLYPSRLVYVLFRDAIIFFIASTFNNALTIISWTAFGNNPKYFLCKGFATPLLSVTGQRLVLNLRGLQTRTYASRDLSREVDRQLQVFAEVGSPGLDDVEELEGVRE
ncbi:hypothetical protein EV702DRAFT_1202132 [Suillus placidus]|uniref:DUF6533 domain-containing protein n=1 Tax=Suillus placidus TaxID=48579 RepID=A0A9P6ZLB6_9AGAM|nr:hypothetical protein EV702DRAFT_1202132 [Suillus placidus]